MNGGIGDNFNVPIIAFQNLNGVVALLGKLLAAPLAQPLTGDGGAVAIFGSQRLHEAGAANVAVEQLVNQPGDIGKKASPVDKGLVIGSIVGDVKVIAPAAVKLGVYPVQGEGHNGENICPQRTFVPGGVYFAGSHIFNVIGKFHRYIFCRRIGRTQMDGDSLGCKGSNSRHGAPPYKSWGGVTTFMLSSVPSGSWDRGMSMMFWNVVVSANTWRLLATNGP